MFYLIESYDEHNEAATRTVVIQTAPGRTNMSNTVLRDGWLGATNNWHSYAHGEFEALEAATAAAEKLGFTAEMPEGDDDAELGIVATYKTPEAAREQWDAAEWFSQNTPEDLGITANTTDAELDAITETLEREANEAVETDRPYGVTLNGVGAYLRDIRSELRDEA